MRMNDEISERAVTAHMQHRANVFIEAAIGEYISQFGVGETIARLASEIEFLREME